MLRDRLFCTRLLPTAGKFRPVCAAVAVVLAAIPQWVSADIVDFVNGDWDHGSGTVSGWQAPTGPGAYQGTTTVEGIDVTVSFTDFGTTTHDYSGNFDHLDTTNVGGGSGIILHQNPSTTYNTSILPIANYTRMDVSLSDPGWVQFFLHDIDQQDLGLLGADWEDAVYVEFFDSGFGAVGSGTRANYELGDDVITENLSGLDGVMTPDFFTAARDITEVNAADMIFPSSARVSFDEPVQFFSLYFYNRDIDSTASDNQDVYLTAFTVDQALIPEPAVTQLLGLVVLASILGRWGRSPRTATPASNA